MSSGAEGSQAPADPPAPANGSGEPTAPAPAGATAPEEAAAPAEPAGGGGAAEQQGIQVGAANLAPEAGPPGYLDDDWFGEEEEEGDDGDWLDGSDDEDLLDLEEGDEGEDEDEMWDEDEEGGWSDAASQSSEEPVQLDQALQRLAAQTEGRHFCPGWAAYPIPTITEHFQSADALSTVELPASHGSGSRRGGILAATFDAQGVAAWLLPSMGDVQSMGMSQPGAVRLGGFQAPRPVYSIAASPDGRHIATGGDSGLLTIYSLDASAPPRPSVPAGRVGLTGLNYFFTPLLLPKQLRDLQQQAAAAAREQQAAAAPPASATSSAAAAAAAAAAGASSVDLERSLLEQYNSLTSQAAQRQAEVEYHEQSERCMYRQLAAVELAIEQAGLTELSQLRNKLHGGGSSLLAAGGRNASSWEAMRRGVEEQRLLLQQHARQAAAAGQAAGQAAAGQGQVVGADTGTVAGGMPHAQSQALLRRMLADLAGAPPAALAMQVAQAAQEAVQSASQAAQQAVQVSSQVAQQTQASGQAPQQGQGQGVPTQLQARLQTLQRVIQEQPQQVQEQLRQIAQQAQAQAQAHAGHMQAQELQAEAQAQHLAQLGAMGGVPADGHWHLAPAMPSPSAAFYQLAVQANKAGGDAGGDAETRGFMEAVMWQDLHSIGRAGALHQAARQEWAGMLEAELAVAFMDSKSHQAGQAHSSAGASGSGSALAGVNGQAPAAATPSPAAMNGGAAAAADPHGKRPLADQPEPDLREQQQAEAPAVHAAVMLRGMFALGLDPIQAQEMPFLSDGMCNGVRWGRVAGRQRLLAADQSGYVYIFEQPEPGPSSSSASRGGSGAGGSNGDLRAEQLLCRGLGQPSPSRNWEMRPVNFFGAEQHALGARLSQQHAQPAAQQVPRAGPRLPERPVHAAAAGATKAAPAEALAPNYMTAALGPYPAPCNLAEPSPDGRWIAVVGDTQAVFLVDQQAGFDWHPLRFDLVNPRARRWVQAHVENDRERGAQYVAWNSSSSLLAVSSDALFAVFVFDPHSRQMVLRIENHIHPCLCIGFAPWDDRMLIYSEESKRVHIRRVPEAGAGAARQGAAGSQQGGGCAAVDARNDLMADVGEGTQLLQLPIVPPSGAQGGEEEQEQRGNRRRRVTGMKLSREGDLLVTTRQGVMLRYFLSAGWTQEQHHSWPPAYRAAVEAMLFCAHQQQHGRVSGLWRLPLPLLLHVMMLAAGRRSDWMRRPGQAGAPAQQPAAQGV